MSMRDKELPKQAFNIQSTGRRKVEQPWQILEDRTGK